MKTPVPFTATISGVAHGGYGVCRHEGRVCFVSYALPGDTVRVQVVREAKGVLWGAIEAIIEPSRDRTQACCPYFGACGGCSWLHFAYPAQAEAKRRIVTDSLSRIGGVDTVVAWIEDPERRLGYRTRATFHGHNGHLGFYAPGTHTVVDITQCPLCHGHLNTALEQLRKHTIEGTVEVTVNPEGPDVLVWTQRPRPDLRKTFPSVGWGRATKRRQFLFDGTPVVNGSFSQSSLLLNRLLVDTVRRHVSGAVRILDLYCGNGNLSLGLAATAQVCGLDRDRAAVRAADNAGRGRYAYGDTAAFRGALGQPWDVVLVDPPRTGAKEIVADLARAQTKAIVYVSCDPATLARDIRTLVDAGWRLAEVTALDLFPNTPHVETVCRLER